MELAPKPPARRFGDPRWSRPRKCKYCKAIFTPTRPQDKDQKYCCANHRKYYWEYGALPFEKLQRDLHDSVMRRVNVIVSGLNDRIEALEKELKISRKVAKVVDIKTNHVITLEPLETTE